MSADPGLRQLDGSPLVAILRGIQPTEVAKVAEVLVDAGWGAIEIPLVDARSLEALERLAEVVDGRVLVGAGTVLSAEQVGLVATHGARLIVSPNFDPGVVRATVARGMVSMPGVATPTEAFAALNAGAQVLKLFPGEQLGPAVVRAWRAVLPPPARLYPVGGVTLESLPAWRAAGASGFGVGTAVYRPGLDPAEVGVRARALAAATTRSPQAGP